MYHSILVPLDGSKFAEQALPLAEAIAKRAGAHLEIVQVHTLFEMTNVSNCWSPYYDPAQDAAFKEGEQAYLDAIASRLQASVSVSSALPTGAVVDGILERVRLAATDLVVMTTHGRGPLNRFWLGSVADQILRHTTVPILLLRPRDDQSNPERTLKRILIPLDGSSLAERVLEPAISLGRLMDAEYTLLRAVEPGFVPYGYPDLSNVSQAEKSWVVNVKQVERDWVEKRKSEAVDYLNKVADRLRHQSLCVQTRVVPCDAVPALLNSASSFDLIAIATHGHGGFKRLLLGSVADKVIRGTVTPVLVYRPTAHD